MARPSKYPEQFQRDAVELVRSTGRPIKHVAVELGIGPEALRLWVRKAEAADAAVAASGPRGEAPLSADERAELRRLRARLAEVEKEKEILRRAAAYFAREMDR